jgi:pimeloyl-ACP methyl ester carboxylesterase
MAKRHDKTAQKYIMPLNINGMEGRVLQLRAKPKKQTREILVIYGHHATLERWYGLAQNFNDFGAITMPDLPGFGGMDSFYEISKKPTLDNYADYLASFVKFRYKKRRVTLVGISFGFLIITRMLQRYPKLVGQVDLLVSIVGFMHFDDFLFKPHSRKLMHHSANIISRGPIPPIIQYGILSKAFLRWSAAHLSRSKARFASASPEEFADSIDYDFHLWRTNDMRTHWATTSEFLVVDNCGSRVALPVWHVASSNDTYFSNYNVEQHMRTVFTDYVKVEMKSKAHTPSILGTKKDMSVMVPPGLRNELSKK